MTVRIRELQQIQDKHNERLTDLTLSQPHPATGQSPEEMKQWQFWEEWAVKVQAAIAQLLGERKPVVEALHGLHTNIVDMGKAVEITSNILKSWQPHLQFMEVETGKIKEMNEHIQFLNRELFKAQQQLERYQLDDPPTQSQFMELVQACELQKNRWADFDNFCTMEKEATIHRGRKVQSLDLKMTQLANHMEKEVGRLASLIATAPSLDIAQSDFWKIPQEILNLPAQFALMHKQVEDMKGVMATSNEHNWAREIMSMTTRWEANWQKEKHVLLSQVREEATAAAAAVSAAALASSTAAANTSALAAATSSAAASSSVAAAAAAATAAVAAAAQPPETPPALAHELEGGGT